MFSIVDPCFNRVHIKGSTHSFEGTCSSAVEIRAYDTWVMSPNLVWAVCCVLEQATLL